VGGGSVSAVTFKPVRDFARVNRALEKLRYTAEELRAFDAHGWHCHYCGSQTHLTADHILAQVNGGTDAADNIVPACRTCNCSKGKRDYEAFCEIIAAEKAAYHMMLDCGDCQ
jgi:5-methylcytosine-specific restriction endonuclease McrA